MELPTRARMPRRSVLHTLVLCGCIALIANAVATGFVGLDFGRHWDEWNLADGLATAVKDFSFLHRNYTYGGVYFAIGFLLLAPHALPFLPQILTEIAANPSRPLDLAQYPAIVSLQRELLSSIAEPGFLLMARGAFLVLGSLATLWVFAAFRTLYPARWLGALAAAGFVATSWEVAYQSRFAVPDAVMMQFAALTFLLIARAFARTDHAPAAGWLLAAAVAAGATFGCKMTGAFTVVPVLAAAVIHRAAGSGPRRLALAFAVVLVFGLAYFITTPGSVIDPIRYFATMAWEGESYANAPDDGIPVRWGLAFVWLFGVVPSAAVALAIPMSIATAAGIAALWRHHRPFLWCYAAFVVAYGTFLTTQNLLLVRHWLPLVPVLAIAFGAGIATFHDVARRRRLPWLVPACLAGIVACNTAWLWIAAGSIRHKDPAAFAARLVAHMAGEPQRVFWLSPDLVSRLASDPKSAVTCAADTSASVSNDDAVAFPASESGIAWPFNRPWFYELIIGSYEVDFSYYPVWIGQNRGDTIVVVTADRARKRRLRLDGYRRCRAGQ
jgi:Dolichyl-phosphate-mannose-protein mannosyltransferase